MTQKADAKCRNLIRRSRKENKQALIIVCGCLVNTNLDDLLSMEQVNILIENKDKDKIVKVISKYFDGKITKKPYVYKTKIDGSFNFKTHNMSKHSRAFLKVQDGCDNYCSFCKIPYARGKERSKNINDIYSEIECFINNGYEEVVLTGINLGSYNNNKISFPDLLYFLNNKFSNIRFRISSIEPQHIDKKFIEGFSQSNICPHIHIPIQSGSNKILKLMNRKYSINEYQEKIAMIRKAKNDTFISTDLIVGFPQEFEEDFLDTLDFIKKINFSFIHLFGYSPREETKAFFIKPKIPERIRGERMKILKSVVDSMNFEYRKRYVNRALDVVIEKKENNYFVGKSDNYINMSIESNALLKPKKRYNVLFTKIDNEKNFGIVLEEFNDC